ncbi:MAG: hypothetical protein ACI4W6_01875 [Acutalibacteraceae bacterium]
MDETTAVVDEELSFTTGNSTFDEIIHRLLQVFTKLLIKLGLKIIF